MAGRLVIQADIDAYNAAIVADGRPPMQPNDVIYPWADRNASNNHYDRTAFTTARLGATIWIENGPYNAIDIGTQTSGSVTVPTDANNPCHVFFFNGQGRVEREGGTLGAADISIYNIDYIIFDQETNTYPGLRDGFGSGKTGTFGVKVKHNFLLKSGMALKIDHTGHTMKRVEIRGCELTIGCFAKIRSVLSENHQVQMVIERNLITRSVGGEGLYIGQTGRFSGDGWNSIIYTVRDNIFAFIAAEGLQLQQMAAGSRVYNNVLFITGHDFKAAFQPFQDTGWQLHHVQGGTKTYNNILYGHGSTGIQVFGVDASAQANPVVFGNERIKINNNLIGGAKKGVSFRTNEGLDMGSGVTFRDNDIIDPQRNYQEVGSISNFYGDAGGDAVMRVIGGTAPDDGLPYLESNTSQVRGLINITRTNTVPSPEFVNSGFDGIDVHKITKWSEVYQVGWYWVFTEATSTVQHPENSIDPQTVQNGHTFIMANDSSGVALTVGHNIKCVHRSGGSFYATVQAYSGKNLTVNNITNRSGSGIKSNSTPWDFFRERTHTAGEFVFLAEDGEVMPMHLYKCLQTHVAVVGDPLARRPDNDPTRWELVWWDANGRNMYDPLYDGTPVTNDFMEVAGDFRLVKGSYHHLKGRGLSCNEQRDDMTMYGWQWKETESGIVRDIPGAYDNKLILNDYSYLRSGRFYRGWVHIVNNAGGLETKVYSAWQTVP